jgi:diguanylate cyclase (GGDEF)-like protein/PAS domain S-box-containing protein
MHWNFGLFSLLLFIAALLALVVAIYAWEKRSMPTGRWLFLLMVGIAIWSICDAIEAAAPDIPTRVLLSQISYIGIYSVPPSLIGLVVAYSDYDKWLTRRNIILLWIIPVIMVLLAATNNWHNLVWSGYAFDPENHSILIYYRGALFWLGLIYAYTTLAFGSFILLQMAMRYSAIFRMQSIALVLASVIPILANVIYILRLGPYPYRNFTPLAFLITGMLTGLSIFRFRMLDLLPVARDKLIASIKDAIIVLDHRNHVVEVNQETQRIFGIQVDSSIGKPLSEVFSDWPQLIEGILNFDSTPDKPNVIQLVPDRWYDVQSSLINDKWGELIGRVILLRDISSLKIMDSALRASEELYRNVTERVNDGIVIAQDEIIKYANPKVLELLGMTEDEILSSPFSEFLSPDQIEFVKENYRRRIHGEAPPSIYESALQRTDGTVIPIELNVALMQYLGKPAVLASINDISERYKAEQEIRSYARQQELLNKIVQASLESLELEKMLDVIADSLSELFNADGCYITLWDEERQIILPATSHKAQREKFIYGPKPDPQEPSLSKVALSEGRVISVENAHNSPLISERFTDAFPVKSLLGLPFIAGDKKLGAALMAYEKLHEFTPEEMLLGERAARQIALAILKTQLIEEERHQRMMAEAYQEMGKILTSSLNFNTVLDNMIHLLKEFIPFDAAAILQVNEGNVSVLRSMGYGDFGNRVITEKCNIEDMPGINRVLSEKEPVILSKSGQQLGREIPQYALYNQSWMGVPIIYEDEIIGIYSLEKGETDFFTENHLGSMTIFSNQAALAITNANLFGQVQQMAIIDPLTGIFNRWYFYTLLNQEMVRSTRYKNKFSLMMLDIDHYKQINDTYGHNIGDEVLNEFVNLCKANLRSVDTISRFGGEEFLILAPELGKKGALILAERLRNLVENTPLLTSAGPVSITVSVGVTIISGDKINTDYLQNVNMIISQADQAMYMAKESGRNCVKVFKFN